MILSTSPNSIKGIRIRSIIQRQKVYPEPYPRVPNFIQVSKFYARFLEILSEALPMPHHFIHSIIHTLMFISWELKFIRNIIQVLRTQKLSEIFFFFYY